MATQAAVLSILVQADGIVQTNRKLQGLHGDLGKAGRAADTMGKNLDTGARKGSRALGALRSGAGLAVGALGAVGLVGAVKSAVGEFEEARKVGALTTQVIKSTGGAAKVSAQEVAELASSISRKVGIDDEAIQSGANLLLTFKNIRNETGRGRDIFNQATAAAVDLSAAGFGSLESTSKQLGKALNDPVKGMTALGRAGVTFSEDQKQAIEALLATGRAADRVKAQQIILREVQSQVGGAAAAQATKLDKLKVTLGNLAEAAGAFLVPALDKAAQVATRFFDGMMRGVGVGGAIVSTFKGVGSATSTLVGWFRQHRTAATVLLSVMAALTTAFVAYKVAVIAAAVASRTLAAAQLALNIVMRANPVGLIVTALIALAAGLVVAYKRSETFRRIVDGAFKVVKDAALAVADAIGEVVEFLKDVVEGAKDAGKWLGKLDVPDLTLKNPFLGKGGAGDGFNVGPGLMGRPASVDGFNRIAGMFGNVVTSGYRPGDPGWHGQNRARDYAGGNMLGFARYMLRTFGSSLLELIHTPLGIGIKNGQVVPISFFGSKVMADHYDHVHVAMRKGGKVPGMGIGDTIPAMLEPGEFVMRKKIVDRFGPTFFAGLNGMKAGGMAGGPTIKSMVWSLEVMQGALAAAKLTPGTADDLEWLRAIERTLAALVPAARQAGRWDLVTQYAPQIGSTREEIDAIVNPPAVTSDTGTGADPNQPLIDATNALAEWEQQRIAVDREVIANQGKILALAGQGDQIVAAVVAAVNGGIGGPVGLGFQSVGFAGGVARY